MSRTIQRNVVLIAAAVSLAAACSAGGGNNVFTSSTGGNTGGESQGGSGGATTTGLGAGGSGFTITTNTGGGSTGNLCNHGPNEDGDNDGWTTAEGDCNDCDPNVNPGAIEVVATADADGGVPEPADEDCDGTIDNVEGPCDSTLAIDDVDPKSGAKAIELCKFTVANPADKKQKTWGVFDAQYTRANGTAFSPGLQVGLESSFGSAVNVQNGARMLVISSGYARTPGQAGACGSQSCQSNAFATAPPGFPQDNPNCPPSDIIDDDVALQLKIRTPTNAKGYSFDFKFYSFEYPEWVCNDYNDQFIALVLPAPVGSINGNVSFDSMHNPVSVNLGFFDVCDPAGKSSYASFCFSNCPSPPSPYCPSGPGELAGTGFDTWNDAGATSWLKSQAPVTGGSDITIRFMMWDTGDQAYDSTTLIDNFTWIASGGTVAVGTDPIGQPK